MADLAISETRHYLKCEHCGTSVTRRTSEIRKKCFCSRECTDAFGRQKIRCCWPQCPTEIECRAYTRRDKNGRVITGYKTEFTRAGSYTRFAICVAHAAVMTRYFGSAWRINRGRIAALADPNVAYDVRRAASKFLRAIIFETAGGKCAVCAGEQDFFAPPKTWQIDHIIPMYQGGLTKVQNLQLLCRRCHDEKTALEKSDATRKRHQLSKVHRWMTHLQKDELIARLRARLVAAGLAGD